MTNLNSELKFITKYSSYITEQEFDEEGMPIPEPVINRFRFIFVVKNQEGIKKYPDGSSSSIFKTFEIKEDDLKKWLFDNVSSVKGSDLTDNHASIKRKTIYDYIIGKKSNLEKKDQEFIKRFRTSVISKIIASEVDKTEVFFSRKSKIPTTDKVDVIFIMVDSK
tara:strand:+ start:670 stop:1164 length:495 start_codon:yes stop_codon:yes gene_type:complete